MSGHFVAVNSNVLTPGVTPSCPPASALAGDSVPVGQLLSCAADQLTGVSVAQAGPAALVDASGATVSAVTIPGGQARAAVTAFRVPSSTRAFRVGSLVTVDFTFLRAGVISVTGTVVDQAPGAYGDDTQEQRGRCLDLIGPNGQGGSQREQLDRERTATPSPEAGCATATP